MGRLAVAAEEKSRGAHGRARTGGRDAKGETGVQSADYTEVLEWDAEVQPIPPRDERAYPQVITAAPPPKPSWFVLPKIKL